jgi:Sec-independent protein translocase protein TatA
MPWWGWLIFGCVGILVLGWVAVAVIAAQATRAVSESFKQEADMFNLRRRP